MNKITTEEFLSLSEGVPVVDVRSPSEYRSGHIPGSFNIPLFNDNEREAVGISYKQKGRTDAILKGLGLIGPDLDTKLHSAIMKAVKGRLLLYCWRGGMRSESMAWLFSLGGIKTEVLSGGYKAYRKHILSSLCEQRRFIVLGGMTGSGKSHILRYIKTLKHQVIDIEMIANHRGSAFGSLGQAPQPSSEHFANMLFEEWKGFDDKLPLWLEDESKNIGTVFMPDCFYNNMQEANAIVLLLDRETRIPRLVEEYSNYPPGLLKESVLKIKKRLGGENTVEALKAIDTGDFSRAAEITLAYYDKSYMYGISKKLAGKTVFVKSATDNIEENAHRVLEAAGKIIW